MFLSIAHRLTGIILYVAVLGLVGWLLLLAFAPAAFNEFQTLLGQPLGRAGLFAVLWAFCHHLSGGIRHFFWDLGIGLGVRGREGLTWGGLVFGFLLALALFFAPNYETILRTLN